MSHIHLDSRTSPVQDAAIFIVRFFSTTTHEMDTLVKRLEILEERNRSLERESLVFEWATVIAFLSCAVAILFRIDFVLWLLVAVACGWALLSLVSLLVLVVVRIFVPKAPAVAGVTDRAPPPRNDPS